MWGGGATVLVDATAQATGAATKLGWELSGEILSTGSATQDCIARGVFAGALLPTPVWFVPDTQSFGSDQTLSVQAGGGAVHDVELHGFEVEAID